RLDAGYVPARYNLALAQLEHGQTEEAVAHLRQVAQSDSAPADTQYRLGVAYRQASAWVQAEAAFRKYLQASPDSPEALDELGGALAHQREYKKAASSF